PRRTQTQLRAYSESTLKQTLARTTTALPIGTIVDLDCGPNPVALYDLGSASWQIAAGDLSTDFCEGAGSNTKTRNSKTHAPVRDMLEGPGFRELRALRVAATDRPPWRTRAAWLIDRLTLRPEWSRKVAFLAVKPNSAP
ncbi:MAG TPA: hypothetical protein VMU73_04315, partial [Gaiellaceae bacterium]|nr:hypothetical protein [Gaiellaceae bacterium]